MGKGHKHRTPPPAPLPTRAPAVSPNASASSAPESPRVPIARRIALQFAAILGLSLALGFVFNAANPIGVQLGNAGSAAELRTGPATNFDLLSTSSIAAKRTAPVTPPPFPPRPLAQPARTSLPPVTTPLASVAPTGAHIQPRVVVSNVPPEPAPATAAAAPTNPAAIHWHEAKQLAASGQAVLVDVRPRAVYDAGHIPDAVSMPETSSFAEFAEFLKLLPTNMTVIVYCSSTSCSQSKRVADRLVGEFHYAPVKYMTGGYLEYQQEELAKSQKQPADR